MDNYFNLNLIPKIELSIFDADKLIAEFFKIKASEGPFDWGKKNESPVIYEYIEHCYDNDFFIEDMEKSGYSNDSWFNVSYYQCNKDEHALKILVIGPSTPSARILIIEETEELAKLIKKIFFSHGIDSSIIYSIDSPLHAEDRIKVLQMPKVEWKKMGIEFVI